jgi:hypothetical protein
MRKAVAMLISVAMITLSSAMPARAHHSAAKFDFTRTEWTEGTVKDISVMNPHMSLTLVTSDDKGTHEVKFEGHSVNNFYRVGWRANMIKVGDHIKARFNPCKDGTAGGFLNGFVTADGKEVLFDMVVKVPQEAPSSSAGK